MPDDALRHGPDIARLAALVGDPARANMLTALMAGKALTAGELAYEAGVTPQTASSHLARMEEAGLLVRRKQGRHRYFALAGAEVARMLESMMGVAAAGHGRTRTGPREPAMREARGAGVLRPPRRRPRRRDARRPRTARRRHRRTGTS